MTPPPPQKPTTSQPAETPIRPKLPKPELILPNKSALTDNYIQLDASSRFIFQCTYESLFIYDLLWKVRR
jgi:hypothetical protein